MTFKELWNQIDSYLGVTLNGSTPAHSNEIYGRLPDLLPSNIFSNGTNYLVATANQQTNDSREI